MSRTQNKGSKKWSLYFGDPGGSRTPNTHLRTVVFYPLNYRASLL